MSRLNCPHQEDYWPCICPYEPYERKLSFSLVCNWVPGEDIKDSVTMKTPASFYEIYINIESNSPSTSNIPRDIFGQHMFRILWIDAENKYVKPLLKVHPEAFRSSRDVCNEITISWVDFKNLSFSFLEGFNLLQYLKIENSDNFCLLDLPPLPLFHTLRIVNSTGLNDWTHFPSLSFGLLTVSIVHCDLSDLAAGRILDWLLNGPSKRNLCVINLDSNILTGIPRQLKMFPSLTSINLQNNLDLSIIDNLSFPIPMKLLNLSSCHITEIKPGAFKGSILISIENSNN